MRMKYRELNYRVAASILGRIASFSEMRIRFKELLLSLNVSIDSRAKHFAVLK